MTLLTALIGGLVLLIFAMSVLWIGLLALVALAITVDIFGVREDIPDWGVTAAKFYLLGLAVGVCTLIAYAVHFAPVTAP